MTSTGMKFYSVYAKNLDKIPIQSGNLIFVRDQRKILLDSAGARTEYSSIILLLTDQQRLDMQKPAEGFYYVEETKILWHYYNSQWEEALGSSGGQGLIIFLNEGEELPSVGKEKVIYSRGSELYKYENGEYILLSNSSNNIIVKTTTEWGAFITKPLPAGTIIVYSDYQVDADGNNIPGIKISDGLAFVPDLPFITKNIEDVLKSHINDDIIHITSTERASWNNKITCEIEDEQELLTFTFN